MGDKTRVPVPFAKLQQTDTFPITNMLTPDGQIGMATAPPLPAPIPRGFRIAAALGVTLTFLFPPVIVEYVAKKRLPRQ